MTTAPHPPGVGWRVRYRVAARYPEGYGGINEYATEAEAVAHRDLMLRLGYSPVDVWAVAHRWIVLEPEPAPSGKITGSTSLLRKKPGRKKKGPAP